MDPRYEVLDDAALLAREYVDTLPSRAVGSQAGLEELRERLARPLTDAGEDARTVIADLARDVEPGLMAVMRVSVVGWQTTAEDADRSAEAILNAARAAASVGVPERMEQPG